MRLYLISQTTHSSYDTFDSAVVCAEDEEKARFTHPSWDSLDPWDGTTEDWSSWSAAQDVTVKYLGEASPDLKPGVVCASFKAG